MPQPTVEPGEYIQENGGFREPPADQRTARFPPILSDRAARGAAATNGGGSTPDTSLRVLGKVVPTLTLLGLLASTRFWAKPTAIAAKTKLTQGPLDYIAQFIGQITGWWNRADPHISHEVSKGAVHGSADLAHTIDLLALRLGQVVFSQAYIANDMTLVTERLITHKIPQTVLRYLRPLRLRIGRVERLTGRALLQVRALRTQLRRDIQRLQREQIDPLKKPVRVTLPGRIHRVETDVRTIKKTQAHDHARLRQLTFILVPGLAAAWLVKTLIRAGLRYTTCQNVKDVGNELCAAPPGSGRRLGRWLSQLLSLAPGFLAFPFICQIIGSVVALAGTIVTPLVEVLAEAGAALCDGKHSAAPALPLETHTLPTPTSPLSIA
jgi:hypothetical protein